MIRYSFYVFPAAVAEVTVTPVSLTLAEGAQDEICITTEATLERGLQVSLTTESGTALGKVPIVL